MQVTEMRTLYTHKHIINLTTVHKSLSHPCFISVQSLRNPLFLRHNFCQYHRHGSDEPSSTGAETKLSSEPGNGNPNANANANARRVFTEYDPLTGRVVSRRAAINARNQESGFDYGDDVGRTYLDEGERTYGNVRKAKSGGRSAGRPNFDRRVEGFSAGERASGRFQKGSLDDKFDRRFGVEESVKNAKKVKSQGFWVCSNCGHREGQKWESCRACKSTGTMNQVSNNDGGGSGNKVSGFSVSGNRLNGHERDRTYGSTQKSNWVGGSWSNVHKRGDSFLNERALGDAKESSSHSVELNTEEAVGNKNSVNDMRELPVSGNSVFPSLQKQAGEVHPQPMTVEQESSNHSVELNTEEAVGNKNSVNDMRELQVSGNSVFPSLQKQAGEVHPQPMTVEQATECTSTGVSVDDFMGGRISEGVNTGEDISGERAVTVAEDDNSTDGLGRGLTSEAVQGNTTSELEVSENAMYSSHPKQVSDVLPSPLTGKQELEMTSLNEIKVGFPGSGNGINDMDIGDTKGSLKLVYGSVSSSGVDKGVKDSSREGAFKVVEKGGSTHGSGQIFSVGDVVMRKKKGKSAWVCSNCGHNEGQWWGSCKVCNCVGTMKRLSIEDYGGSGDATGRFEGSEDVDRSWLPKRADQVLPMRVTDVNRGINKLEWRIPLSGSFGSEVARVLGGGLVPGSLVLVGGDPGVGKSTLLLQLAAIIAEGDGAREPGPVVYVSGEESVEQIGNRADRMEIGAKELFLYSGTDIEDILGKAHLLSPRLLIIDSIQTVYLKGVTGSAGGLSQVKECTSALLRYAKKTNVPVLLIGHVTKTGDIAGPRVLEHIVDVVLYLEGERYTSHRLLRSIKNRFGSTDELGVFEMSQSGLHPLINPSQMYLTEQQSDSEFLAGLAVAVIMDGTRSFLIEIQALCVSGSRPSRHSNGVQDSRADMIISVLTKQAGLKLQDCAVFLNVVSGVTLPETAGDLAIAAAICSSFLELPIPTGFAFVGEIGLSGELRGVPRMDVRLNTVAQLGYKKCIVPKSAAKSLKGLDHKEMEIIGCSNLKQVIHVVFATTPKIVEP